MSARMAAWAGMLALAAALGTDRPAAAELCAKDRFEDADYIVCTIDPSVSDLRLFWREDAGEPYRSFSNLAEAVEADGKRLVLAFNAGMYGTDFSPVGLHVENGRELRPANTTEIDRPAREVPNFYKKPNGIFFVGAETAGILPTDVFVRDRPAARFATQSGPMLVIGGALHPAFIPGSTDRTRRSGIGVCEGGRVRFAISETRVNFHDFARLFRDRLSCTDALFLDGGRGTGLYWPATGRNDRSWHGGYGPMLAVIE